MEKENSYTTLLNRILTVQQQRDAIQLLREAHQSLYAPNVNTKDVLESKLPHFIVENILTMADKGSIPLTDIPALQKLIDGMREYLEKLPVVEIIVAFIPTYRQVQKMAEWWEEYAGVHVILSLQVDENIIGGVKISFNGLYKDYSLSYWLQQNASSDVDQFM